MNLIEKLPMPKAWSVCRMNDTGLLDLGYVESDGYAKMTEKTIAAKLLREAQPEAPKELRYPSNRDANGVTLSPAAYAELKAEYNKAHDAHWHWHRMGHYLERTPLDYLPVYRESLTFTGYSRGRSSTTMDFKAANGQELSFGPSGIGGLLESIAAGDTVVEDGKFTVTFTFAKRGANVYAEVHKVGE